MHIGYVKVLSILSEVSRELDKVDRAAWPARPYFYLNIETLFLERSGNRSADSKFHARTS
jgi:hypothetical protein